MNRLEITSFKERVDLVKVVGHYSTLERKGAAYLGLCPFHDDHHPSLRVDPAKRVYHCFSCGAGGDVFRFVQEKEGCGFGEKNNPATGKFPGFRHDSRSNPNLKSSIGLPQFLHPRIIRKQPLCGTNLSEHHIAMIRKEAVTVCLFLDADEVGRETVTGVMPKLRSAGLRVVDILPEGGKDADEMFRSLGREAFIHWVEKAMIPPARRKAESLLVAACHRWPDTLCLTEEGEEVLYVDNIRKILSSDDLLPADSLVPALDAGPQKDRPETKELDNLYALHTDSSHSDRVRRSELVRYLFLNYLEVRLVDRVRQNLHRLSRRKTPARRYPLFFSIDESPCLFAVSQKGICSPPLKLTPVSAR